MSTRGKRLSILSTSEITEIYSVPRFTINQKKHFFSLNANEEGAMKRLRTIHNRVFFVLLLGYFKAKPINVEFKLTEVQSDIDFILSAHFTNKKLPRKTLTKQIKSRLYTLVCQLVGYRLFDTGHNNKLETHAKKIAAVCVDPRYVFDEYIDFLAVHSVALPSYSTIQKIVSAALSTEKLRTESFINANLPGHLKDQINYFINPDESVSILTSLKTLPKDITHKEISKEIDTFNTLKEIYPEATKLLSELSLSEKNIEYYASLVDFYTITKLRRFKWETTALYILSFISYRYRQINDNLVNAFIYHIRKLTEVASGYARTKVLEENEAISDKIKQTGYLLKLFLDEDIDDNTPFKAVRERAFSILPKKDIPKVTDQLENTEWDTEISEALSV